MIEVGYARMWPRGIFYRDRAFIRSLEVLGNPGVYVLYRNDIPYYVGQAKKLRSRLWSHANRADTRYYNHWNFFSVFVEGDPKRRNEIEAILIAAMPTVNSAKPRLKRHRLPLAVQKMLRDSPEKQASVAM